MSRKTYVLVPGAWHGSWCWERIVPALEGAGHSVIAPDLPGSEPEGASVAQVTLEQWVGLICARIEELSEPVILVGHSRGGIVISQVAERVPQKIDRLVYVAGLLVRSGQSALGTLREEGSSALLSNVSLSEDRSRWVPREGTEQGMFYGECDPQDARWASAQLGIEPAKPLMTPLHLTEARFGRIPRTYIECLRDGAVPLTLQRQMQQRLPCGNAMALDTDHAPFLSAPDELVAHLLALA